MMQILLNRFLNQNVNFRTSGNVEKIGEVRILGDGSVGIVTSQEVFSSMDIKKVRRLK